MPYCTKCRKKRDDGQVRKCCEGTHYCNRKCERADYANHESSCTKLVVVKERAPPLHEPALIKDIYNPFRRLKRGDYLHNRPDTDVYKTLIDAYRLRMHDNYVVAGVCHADSTYGNSEDGIAGFRGFLDRAKAIPRMMPSWWNDRKQAECEDLGRRTGWSSLAAKIDENEVCKHYNPPKHYTAKKQHTGIARRYYKDVAREDYYDIYIDIQLRLLAEHIYGRSIGDVGGWSLRGEMMNIPDEELGEMTETGNWLRRAVSHDLNDPARQTLRWRNLGRIDGYFWPLARLLMGYGL